MVTITNVRPSKTAGKTVIEYTQLNAADADLGHKGLTAYKSIATEKLDSSKIFKGKEYPTCKIILVDLNVPRPYTDSEGNPKIQTKETVLV